MKSKFAMIIYILFAILSFFFGVMMFKMGDTLRGVLFMVAVACWGMCIYNNSGTSRRQNKEWHLLQKILYRTKIIKRNQNLDKKIIGA